MGELGVVSTKEIRCVQLVYDPGHNCVCHECNHPRVLGAKYAPTTLRASSGEESTAKAPPEHEMQTTYVQFYAEICPDVNMTAIRYFENWLNSCWHDK